VLMVQIDLHIIGNNMDLCTSQTLLLIDACLHFCYSVRLTDEALEGEFSLKLEGKYLIQLVSRDTVNGSNRP
jgi:hypothetical protein